jgi:hypothetical protein
MRILTTTRFLDSTFKHQNQGSQPTHTLLFSTSTGKQIYQQASLLASTLGGETERTQGIQEVLSYNTLSKNHCGFTEGDSLMFFKRWLFGSHPDGPMPETPRGPGWTLHRTFAAQGGMPRPRRILKLNIGASRLVSIPMDDHVNG